MNDGLRLVKRDDGWHWVCPVCRSARSVSEHKACGNCGASTMSGDHRRVGAASRNLTDTLLKPLTPTIDRLEAWLRRRGW